MIVLPEVLEENEPGMPYVNLSEGYFSLNNFHAWDACI